MRKVRKRITRLEQLREIRQQVRVKRPLLVKTKQTMTVKQQEFMKNRQKRIIKKVILPPMLVPEAVSDAGKLLVDPKSPANVKRVAASRLRVERILKALRLSKLLKKKKRKKNKY